MTFDMVSLAQNIVTSLDALEQPEDEPMVVADMSFKEEVAEKKPKKNNLQVQAIRKDMMKYDKRIQKAGVKKRLNPEEEDDSCDIVKNMRDLVLINHQDFMSKLSLDTSADTVIRSTPMPNKKSLDSSMFANPNMESMFTFTTPDTFYEHSDFSVIDSPVADMPPQRED